jgi:hypothetical protein
MGLLVCFTVVDEKRFDGLFRGLLAVISRHFVEGGMAPRHTTRSFQVGWGGHDVPGLRRDFG